MEIILTIHGRFSTTVWLFLLILGLWSLWRAIRSQGVNGSFLGALVIAQLMILIQAIMGGLLWFNGGGANLVSPAIHYLYAGFSLVFMPFVFLYWLRGDDSNRAQWVLSFAILFQFGTIFYRFGPFSLI